MGWCGNRKRAAICAASAAVIGLCAWQVWGAEDGIRFARSVTLVDVNSGQLFEFALDGRAVSIPARNPDAGVRSRLPVREREGRWFLAPREAAALASLPVQPDAVIDRASGEVRVPGAPRAVGEW